MTDAEPGEIGDDRFGIIEREAGMELQAGGGARRFGEARAVSWGDAWRRRAPARVRRLRHDC